MSTSVFICSPLIPVTKLNIHVVNTVMCYVCVIYTMLGGIQAVVWTDVMRFESYLIIVLSVFLIFLLNLMSFFHVDWLFNVNRCYKEPSWFYLLLLLLCSVFRMLAVCPKYGIVLSMAIAFFHQSMWKWF